MIEMAFKSGKDADAVIKRLGELGVNYKEGVEKGVLKAAIHMEERIDNKLESGTITPALKPATIARKGSSKPLIDSGEMKGQVDHSQIEPGKVKVGVIGGRAGAAVTHEFGDPSRGIPERSFIRSTWNEEKGAVKKIISDSII